MIHHYVHLTLHWPFVNLGIGTSALESELILQTPLFPVPEGLWTPNLAGWWFRMRRPTHRVTWLYDIVVTWQTKNIISPLLQGLLTANLADWCFGMRGPPSQSHVATRQIKNILWPHSQGPWPPKLVWVLNQDEGSPPKKSCDTSIVQSNEKTKASYLLNQRAIGM